MISRLAEQIFHSQSQRGCHTAKGRRRRDEIRNQILEQLTTNGTDITSKKEWRDRVPQLATPSLKNHTGKIGTIMSGFENQPGPTPGELEGIRKLSLYHYRASKLNNSARDTAQKEQFKKCLGSLREGNWLTHLRMCAGGKGMDRWFLQEHNLAGTLPPTLPPVRKLEACGKPVQHSPSTWLALCAHPSKHPPPKHTPEGTKKRTNKA